LDQLQPEIGEAAKAKQGFKFYDNDIIINILIMIEQVTF
jgi:hypothetical protein